LEAGQQVLGTGGHAAILSSLQTQLARIQAFTGQYRRRNAVIRAISRRKDREQMRAFRDSISQFTAVITACKI